MSSRRGRGKVQMQERQDLMRLKRISQTNKDYNTRLGLMVESVRKAKGIFKKPSGKLLFYLC